MVSEHKKRLMVSYNMSFGTQASTVVLGICWTVFRHQDSLITELKSNLEVKKAMDLYYLHIDMILANEVQSSGTSMLNPSCS